LSLPSIRPALRRESSRGSPTSTTPNELDFVDIATPSATHAALGRWALEHDLHVLCEKPVALTRTEAEALASLSGARGKVLVPCHQYRANPVWRRIRRWLEAGAIGRWHLCEISVYRTQADRGSSADALPWRVRKREAGGGVLLDHGTHLLYTVLDLAGVPSRLSSWIGTLAHPSYEVEDTAQIRLEYPNRLATLFLTWAARRRETRVQIVGERGSITWVDGILALEQNGTAETIDCSRELDKQSYAQWFADLFAHFGDTLDAGAASALADAARDDVVLVSTVLEAAYRSASLGAPVPLPAVVANAAASPSTRSAAVR
jgi:predicted dehydrogenase